MRVLGVDTSIRSSGVAMIEANGSVLKALDYGVIKNPAATPLSECLSRIYVSIVTKITTTRPDAAAIEGVFYCKNIKTAVMLGEARGVVMAACASYKVPVYEYSPRRVKQSVAGFGAAGKDQVQKMVIAILGLQEKLSDDESDALAVAICHAHTASFQFGDNSKAI